MCLCALAIGMSAQRPLLLASNRDEFHARPTLPLAQWVAPSGQTIVSGRDLEAGGSWLGLTPSGRLALLTNVREPGATAGPRSRGELPLAWLQGTDEAPAFLARLEREAYSGFNLLIGDVTRGDWHWVSNRQAQDGRVVPGWQHRRLEPGLYGLSNAFLDTPWPKTLRLKAALDSALSLADPGEALWPALADERHAGEDELPATGMSPEAERLLSSAFVRFPDGRYGTRASTLVMAEATAQGLAVRVQEKSWQPDGQWQLRQEALRWPTGA